MVGQRVQAPDRRELSRGERERDFQCYLGLVLKEVSMGSARTRPCAQVPSGCSGLWAQTQDSRPQPHPCSREGVSISMDP